MTDFIERLKSLKLPSWMDRGDAARLRLACIAFWTQVYKWLCWPLGQFDALTCAEPVLNLLAWERDITRFKGEPLALFRRRVGYAFVNARDAGEIAGFIAIFERLEIGYVELLERQLETDWDVIVLRVTDGQIAANSNLLLEIVRKYGRTCRRYRFEVLTGLKVPTRIGSYEGDYVCHAVSLGDIPAQTVTSRASVEGEK